MIRNEPRLQALFAAASELAPAQRDELLTRECADDPGLRAEIEALLAADARLQGTTARPFISPFALQLPASLVGRRVGAWELREEIGHGGMGTVYRAERVDGSVQQSVAIKFVRRELLDAVTRRRFELERQLMASLDHPYIARLLDASQLEDGTPYYVMELVRGVPITEYCERERLDLRARVVLMRKVCGAVSEAHRELIVHRDLKPGNILVDAAGNPKLLDFGIAKPLNAASGAPGSEQTHTAQRCFSPQYAAPEQLSGGPLGVACDIYALGLLLYEVLGGCRPYDLHGLSHAQVERQVREVPPPAPSQALERRTGADIRMRQLRGDLDGIVMRCLRKLPAERYASVERLEADLCNYLEGRPVQARGGHRWYRAQKFVRRNALAVTAGALLAVSLIGGAAAFAWQARIATRRAAELEQVAKFQADMLEQVDPARAGQLLSTDIMSKYALALEREGVAEGERAARVAAFGEQWARVNVTDAARDLVDSAIVTPALATLDAKFKDQPALYAQLSQVLAERYLDWGLLDAAQPLQQRALSIRRRLYGEHHADTLASLRGAGLLLQAQGKFADARICLSEVLEQRRTLLGARHRDTLMSMNELAELLQILGELPAAEALARESLEAHRQVFGQDDLNTLVALNAVGAVVRREGKLAEAEQIFRASLQGRRRVLGADHPLTLIAVASLAETLRTARKTAEAEPYYREYLDGERRLYGEMHPETIKALNAMATEFEDEGKVEEGEAGLRDALERSRKVLGPDHPDTVQYVTNMGLHLLTQHRTAEAEPYMLEAWERRRRLYGPESQEALRTTIQLAALRGSQRRNAEVVELLAGIEGAARRTFTGDNIYQLAKLQMALGVARARLDQFAAAESNLREARANFEKTPATDDGDRADCAAGLAVLHARWDKAEPGKGHAQTADEQIREAHRLDPGLPPIKGAEVADVPASK